MSGHTPGPWSVYSWDDKGTPVIGVTPVEGGGDVADCSVNNWRGMGVLEANARLIAAAPDLLAAALEAKAAMDSIWRTKGLDDDFIYDEMGSELSVGYFSLRAAIARATQPLTPTNEEPNSDR